MKKIIILFCILNSLLVYSQDHSCSRAKKQSLSSRILFQARNASSPAAQISHEYKYDVKFVHLDLKLERINKYIVGGVKTIATVTLAPLDTFMTLLHQNLIIDSIRFNGMLLSALRQDSMVKIKTPSTLNNGTSFTVSIYYKGTPPVGGSAIGSGFSNGTSGSWGNQATWSLSESLVAYHWWPTKQILTDKIDSSWVFVTTDSINKVGSNGKLKNVVTIGNKKRYEWKSRTPIAYYLISVAVAKYKEYNLYAHPLYLPNDSILIQNYIYDGAINNTNWINQQKVQLNKMPQVLEFQSKMYGMYPFYKEKYGHCMAPFGGGMEHQTMTSLGFFEYYINAHELGHQWWGDNVTCKGWADIWINEGFASYTEHLVAQYLDPTNFLPNLNAAHNSVMSQPGGSVFFTNHDTVDANVIFNSRLTYDKGGAIIRSLQFLTNNDSVWFNTLRGFQNTYKNNTASVIDFKNYYQTQTGINATQFFNQWYYGEGYPTFNVKYNFSNGVFYLKNTQSVSMPNVTPFFTTPLQYKISRVGQADTTVRLNHFQATENFSFALTGTVSAVSCDPNNWIINKVVGPSRDLTLGINPTSMESIDLQTNNTQIFIGPNPSSGIINITKNNEDVLFAEVFDINGNLILQSNFQKQLKIDLTNYVNGVYLINVLEKDKQLKLSQKIIKQ